MDAPDNRTVRWRPHVPKIVLARKLWTMTRPPNKPITAAIFDTEFGRELRVMVGDDVDNTIDSLLSRTGDEPLGQRAMLIRVTLEEQGWRSKP